ncbi:hypothetical protein MVEN_00065900 [Mycena venus]|uniref:Uncharacterized protein n=1 Tax=Mycena venus TaxID=2733690 RepID=A0A8H6Z840_9AGAR|nr:hypothetical protein MVEN_00065900 [Mycena venus]
MFHPRPITAKYLYQSARVLPCVRDQYSAPSYIACVHSYLSPFAAPVCFWSVSRSGTGMYRPEYGVAHIGRARHGGTLIRYSLFNAVEAAPSARAGARETCSRCPFFVALGYISTAGPRSVYRGFRDPCILPSSHYNFSLFISHSLFVQSSLIVSFDHRLAISLRRCSSPITGCMPSLRFSHYRNPSVYLFSLLLNCGQYIHTRLVFPPQSHPESMYIHAAHLRVPAFFFVLFFCGSVTLPILVCRAAWYPLAIHLCVNSPPACGVPCTAYRTFIFTFVFSELSCIRRRGWAR